MGQLLLRFWKSSHFIWRLARIVLFAYVGLVLFVMIFEERFIFYPTPYPDGDWEVSRFQPAEGQIAPRIEDCFFTTTDSVKLHGWLCTPQQKTGGAVADVPTRMTLLWFHGNAGNLSYRYDMLRALIKIPVRIFIMDYRGYGRSEGTPSEEGLYRDAQAAWEYLTTERGFSARQLIIFGKSLGGVPAIDLATKVEAAGLIVQSSFTSAADMARAVLPFIPSAIIRTRMDSRSKIQSVRCAKLIIHSPADEVVPFALGRKLFEVAAEPKQFYEVKNAGHNETYMVGGNAYLEALRSFIALCAPPA